METPYLKILRNSLARLSICVLVTFIPRAEASQDRPNVLLITSEDHGPDIGCYGETRITTPHLDQLAAEGSLCSRAFVTYAVCSPSRASILTGLYAHQHGHMGLATHKYSMIRAWPNMASLLHQAGYRTGIIGKLHVNPSEAFPFDVSELSGGNFNSRPMAQFAERAGAFIDAGDEPFFLMVNFPDAHFPLLTQQQGLPAHPIRGADIESTLPFLGVNTARLRDHVADYLNCLKRLDDGVGLLRDELEHRGQLDKTLIIYCSDHGAQFSRGKTTCYEAGLRVPMIVRWPDGDHAGTRLDQLISTVDLLPTVLDVCGISPPAGLPGSSLVSFAKDPTLAGREYLCSGKAGSTPFWTFPQRSIRDKRWKLIRNLKHGHCPTAQAYRDHVGAFFVAGCERQEIANSSHEVQRAYETWERPGEFELYDLANDPYEFNNLSSDEQYKREKQRLIAALRAWQKDTGDPFGDPWRLQKYIHEMRQVSDRYGGRAARYRRDSSFRWQYPEYLYP